MIRCLAVDDDISAGIAGRHQQSSIPSTGSSLRQCDGSYENNAARAHRPDILTYKCRASPVYSSYKR